MLPVVQSTGTTSVVTSVGVKIKCKKLTDKEEFMCRPVDIYRALTEQEVWLFIICHVKPYYQGYIYFTLLKINLQLLHSTKSKLYYHSIIPIVP